MSQIDQLTNAEQLLDMREWPAYLKFKFQTQTERHGTNPKPEAWVYEKCLAWLQNHGVDLSMAHDVEFHVCSSCGKEVDFIDQGIQKFPRATYHIYGCPLCQSTVTVKE